MAKLLQLLEEFNRKERFYVVGMTFGNKRFQLSEEFRKTLGRKLGIYVPENAFAAMDYHLDWLAASLYLTARPGASPPHGRDAQLITGTQEDIDFLVAYESDDWCYVIMLEAKGVTGFTNKQFRLKVDRLVAMSKAPGWQSAKVIPHFALISPKKPKRLKYDRCPDWMVEPDGEPTWIELRLPELLKRVERCDQAGTPSQQGDHWKVVTEKRGKMAAR